MNLRDLSLRIRALLAPRRTERELADELAFHIERETQRHVAGGLDPGEARARARARFGSVTVAADACRDERGTGWLDGLVRDVRYAIRAFRRMPTAALTIVATVGLGLGLVAAIFTLLNGVIFRVDAVQDPHELFAVEQPRLPNGDQRRFTRPQYEALVRETRAFSGAFAMLPDIDSRIEGRMMAGTLVSGNFFQVLGVRAALGRTLTPADDEHGAPHPVTVLSHRGWSRHFAGDPAVLGRTMLAGGAPFQIVGVMPEDFRGLMVDAPDYWAPLSQLGQVRPIHAGREDRVGIDVIGRLRSGVSRTAAQAELAAWHMRSSSTTPAARPDTSLVLEPRTGTVSRPAEAMLVFTPLLFAFGLILLIGCANVANLLLARGVARRREIGVRLALGASRGRVIRQLLTESLLLAFLSAGLAFAVSRLTLHLSINAITATMPPDIGDIRLAAPPADWRVALFLVAGAIASTLVFALAPALHATRLELVGAMRGEVLRDARPGRARTALIALQVAASTWLLICSALFLQSARTAASADPGIRTADTLFVDIINEDKRAAMIDAVRREPSVVSVAASAPDALARPREAFAEGSAGRWPVAYRLASADYFDVLGIDVLRGRAFNAGERTADAAVAMVSDSVARLLWPDRDAVGQVMHLAPDLDSETQPRDETPLQPRSFVVVGVARDVAGFRMAGFKEAGIYLPTNADAAKTSLTVRVQGDPEIGRRTLLDRLTAVDPNMGQVLTFRTIAGLETYGLRVASSITFALGSLALVLTLSGLFSVLSFLVEQRAREIGVRMALGATRWQVCALVLRQVARPVGFGLAAGTGLAVTCGALLLATPAAARIQSIVDLFDPVAYTASLFVIVAACVGSALIPTLRAGRIDPAVTLRHD